VTKCKERGVKFPRHLSERLTKMQKKGGKEIKFSRRDAEKLRKWGECATGGGGLKAL